MQLGAVCVLVTGGSGVLGRAAIPLMREGGYNVNAPTHAELDLFDADALRRVVSRVDAVVHLATRIPPADEMTHHGAWTENDLLRERASSLLVSAALEGPTSTFVLPTVTFVYPEVGRADEQTPPRDVPPHLISVLAAEAETARFAASGRNGVVLRLGLLDGPGSGREHPDTRLGATLHIADAGRALLAALRLPTGIYNVCRDSERVSNEVFKTACGWSPTR